MSFLRTIMTCFSVVAVTASLSAFAAPADKVPTAHDINPPVTATSTASSEEKININTANVDELKTLKGIGATKAEAIVDYRTQHGSFKTIEDLGNVKGINGKIMENVVK